MFGIYGVREPSILPPSTMVRWGIIGRELEKRGFSSRLLFHTTRNFSRNIKAIRESDIVFFHRLQVPWLTGPQIPTDLSLLSVSKLNSKLTVFDLDESIFLQFPVLTECFLASSDLVCANSHFMLDYALKWNDHLHHFPFSVDTKLFDPKKKLRKAKSHFTIGWHGTAYVQASNLKLIRDCLRNLAAKHDVTFKLLGAMKSRRTVRMFAEIPNLKLELGPGGWIPHQEIPEYLADVDVAVSPLRDSMWSHGKGALKILESMAMGIPVVASAIGENNYIIQNGVNGLLVYHQHEWAEKISRLLEDPALCEQIGQQARRSVKLKYSNEVVADRLADRLLESL